LRIMPISVTPEGITARAPRNGSQTPVGDIMN
jgi:hypothetical protein